VDDRHQSRLASPEPAVYYLVTLVLQLVPYTLAGGAGVALGVSSRRVRGAELCADGAVRVGPT
jgi:hypothetical protein